MPVERDVVPPGGTIGIIGGGQLGRMTALAAARLGYRCHIYSPDPDSPAFQVSAAHTVAAYEDVEALGAFADAVDVVTFEFENVPAGSVRTLAAHVPVRPNGRALEIAQDRVAEKTFFGNLQTPTAPWRPVRSLADLESAVAFVGRPCVLKTARFGYDGKGQVKITETTDVAAAFHEIGQAEAILEGWIDFDREISIIVARGWDGHAVCFEPSENVHRHHILHTSCVPARISAALDQEARGIALRAAEALDLVGLLAVELFVTRQGTLIANEMAPRPHNSGHWTMNACTVDQFEQFVRAICGLPLGRTDRHCDIEMTNLIGDDVSAWRHYLEDSHAHLHLYGKADARPGRKMGHVNRCLRLRDV